ncbi:hypothetical protein SSBR45G_60380 [Bradyrhizobium sp. SSBR45G]|uniref:hypothetical protein n=1 Tax=unclassified Bradyrhizobium TaxID=2631580 RepID=UPI0023429F21|nr:MULTISPECIES: hypothetical protein [unclassified Bradyrhizobium]GLH81129.1 hypothetical protein SSBR45G_60380 [Bradyrhizobium sp. SSBR45G]GLH88498.1 hypothetical protein SSBR45R_59590 [Bradyrhizobium sp. SSBR45R]
MAMKSTVVIVAVTLALAILLAASLLIIIERRGELSLSPLTEDGRTTHVQLMSPPSAGPVQPVSG